MAEVDLDALLGVSAGSAVGGARTFDAGKDEYKRAHPGEPGRHTRHILPNALLERYGADPAKYAAVAEGINYRMGGSELNLTRDRLVDGAIERAVFENKAYDAEALANYKGVNGGVTYAQQGELLGLRFDRALEMYRATGEPVYRTIAEDVRKIAKSSLDGVDLREWKMPPGAVKVRGADAAAGAPAGGGGGARAAAAATGSSPAESGGGSGRGAAAAPTTASYTPSFYHSTGYAARYQESYNGFSAPVGWQRVSAPPPGVMFAGDAPGECRTQ